MLKGCFCAIHSRAALLCIAKLCAAPDSARKEVQPMSSIQKKNSVRTTKKVATVASKTLAKSSSSKTSKTLAASTLSNRRK